MAPSPWCQWYRRCYSNSKIMAPSPWCQWYRRCYSNSKISWSLKQRKLIKNINNNEKIQIKSSKEFFVLRIRIQTSKSDPDQSKVVRIRNTAGSLISDQHTNIPVYYIHMPNQCCGSGTGSVLDSYSGALWIRIRIQNSVPDPQM